MYGPRVPSLPALAFVDAPAGTNVEITGVPYGFGAAVRGCCVVTIDQRSTSAAVGVRTRARVRWRVVLLALYSVAFGIFVVIVGLPAGRDWLVLWLLGALVLASVGQARGPGRLIVDFLPLVAVLLVYDLLKGRTHTIAGHVYTYPQIRFDEVLFGGTVPTVRLQHWFYTPGSPHVWDYLLTLVYVSYFVVPLVAAALVWQFRHEWFKFYALMLVILAAMALATYALFPATPPWLAGQHHDIPHVYRVIHGLADEMHINMDRAFGSKSTYVNPIAAIPSLHFAVTSGVVLFFWSRTRRWRRVLVTWLIAMALALVYLGEHYVFDLVVGAVYAVIAYFAAQKILEVYAARRRSRAAMSR
jgi:membrane-associated phospholipid phosphatase